MDRKILIGLGVFITIVVIVLIVVLSKKNSQEAPKTTGFFGNLFCKAEIASLAKCNTDKTAQKAQCDTTNTGLIKQLSDAQSQLDVLKQSKNYNTNPPQLITEDVLKNSPKLAYTNLILGKFFGENMVGPQPLPPGSENGLIGTNGKLQFYTRDNQIFVKSTDESGQALNNLMNNSILSATDKVNILYKDPETFLTPLVNYYMKKIDKNSNAEQYYGELLNRMFYTSIDKYNSEIKAVAEKFKLKERLINSVSYNIKKDIISTFQLLSADKLKLIPVKPLPKVIPLLPATKPEVAATMINISEFTKLICTDRREQFSKYARKMTDAYNIDDISGGCPGFINTTLRKLRRENDSRNFDAVVGNVRLPGNPDDIFLQQISVGNFWMKNIASGPDAYFSLMTIGVRINNLVLDLMNDLFNCRFDAYIEVLVSYDWCSNKVTSIKANWPATHITFPIISLDTITIWNPLCPGICDDITVPNPAAVILYPVILYLVTAFMATVNAVGGCAFILDSIIDDDMKEALKSLFSTSRSTADGSAP